MILTFESGGEYAKLDIDRANKKVKVQSAKTNYEVKEVGNATILTLLDGETVKAVIKHWQYFRFVVVPKE